MMGTDSASVGAVAVGAVGAESNKPESDEWPQMSER